jgi:hypothetical protein
VFPVRYEIGHILFSIRKTPLQRGYYIRAMTAKGQLQNKSLVVILKGVGAKTNCLAVNCQL